jgi:hypothetical protein
MSAALAAKMISVCPVMPSGPSVKRASQNGGLRKPSAPKNSRPRPVSAKVHAHRNDQQHQHAAVGQAER